MAGNGARLDHDMTFQVLDCHAGKVLILLVLVGRRVKEVLFGGTPLGAVSKMYGGVTICWCLG